MEDGGFPRTTVSRDQLSRDLRDTLCGSASLLRIVKFTRIGVFKEGIWSNSCMDDVSHANAPTLSVNRIMSRIVSRGSVRLDPAVAPFIKMANVEKFQS